MNILVITDNTYLWQSFKHIVEELGIVGVRFDYACSPSSRAIFQATGKNPTPKPILVRNDFPNIVKNYDLVISLHCKQLFPDKMVREIRCINIHPGLNPFNRGWYPQVFSIINKLPHGATIHEIDAELDHGPIIAQKTVELHPWDNSLSAYERVQDVEICLIRENLEAIVKNNYVSKPPSSEGNVNYIKDFKSLCRLDLNQTVTIGEAIDLFRALSHPPHNNAHFYTIAGDKIFIQLELKRDST